MEEKNIRQSDIADKLHISRTTVARALAGRNVSEETRESVLKAAKEMGYVPNIAAGVLAQKKSKLVHCFIIGTIDKGYSKMMIKGISDTVKNWSDYSYRIHIVVTDINSPEDKCKEQLKQFHETVSDEKPDGIIFSALCKKNLDEVSCYCEKNKIPLMTLDAIYKNENLCHIGSDYYHFGETSAAYLIGLMKKSGRLLTLSCDEGYNLSTLRMEGFLNRIKKCKEIECRNIKADNISYDTYKKIIRQQVDDFMPDAIYAPYKMDYVVQIIQEFYPEKEFIMISNGINKKIENYLHQGIISGIVSNRPYSLGTYAANNFFNYFYRPMELKKQVIDVGFDIYIKENYSNNKEIL